MLRSAIATAAATLVATAALLSGCGDSATGPEGAPVFVVQVVDESFRVRITDADRVAQARRILQGEEPQKIVMGRLMRGNGGFNTGYSWQLDPASIQFVEAAIELCDGKPSFVERELDYWIDTVKSYCPWASRITGEER